MVFFRNQRFVGVFALLMGVFPLSVLAENDAVFVMVNDSVEIQQIDLDGLRAIYSLRKTFWFENQQVTVLVLDVDGDSHRNFCRDILKVYPHQLQKGWDRMEYTGRAIPPQIVESEAMLLSLIQQTPGAIGYLSRPTVIDGAHLLRVVE